MYGSLNYLNSLFIGSNLKYRSVCKLFRNSGFHKVAPGKKETTDGFGFTSQFSQDQCTLLEAVKSQNVGPSGPSFHVLLTAVFMVVSFAVVCGCRI